MKMYRYYRRNNCLLFQIQVHQVLPQAKWEEKWSYPYPIEIALYLSWSCTSKTWLQKMVQIQIPMWKLTYFQTRTKHPNAKPKSPGRRETQLSMKCSCTAATAWRLWSRESCSWVCSVQNRYVRTSSWVELHSHWRTSTWARRLLTGIDWLLYPTCELSQTRTVVLTCALCIFLLEDNLYILKQETLHFNRYVGPMFR